MMSYKVVYHIHRDLIVSAFGDYHIGKFFARLNECLVHRFYRRHILTYYRFKRSFSFVYVADYSAEYSYIGVGVDIYFYIH